MAKLKDTIKAAKEFFNEYKRYKSGVVGLFLLIFLVILSVAAPLIASTEAYNNWYNLKYWKELPSGAPPAWINLFLSEKKAVHKIVFVTSEETVYSSEGEIHTYTATAIYHYRYDQPPNDIIIRILGKTPSGKNASITLKVIRPDEHEITLYTFITSFPEQYEGYPCKAVVFSRNEKIGRSVMKWASQFESDENLEKISGRPALGRWIINAVFSKAETGILVGEAPPLKGDYKFVISVSFYEEENEFYGVKLIIAGGVYGIVGTDVYGRDLFVGIVWGCRLALLIGVLTSLISTAIGVFYGIVSAYKGGMTDELMQRIYEIVASIPLLPVLLILSWKFGATIWNIALIMALFWWTGPVKTVRSMAFQIKEETYIEAARAVGVGTRRIIVKYIASQVVPYAFAIMALGVPGAILTEAGISFLLGGRGVREPTWGKILHDASVAGATMKGMWWWVVSPGVMICLTGLTFVMIGNALDRILNPALRR